jgi:predicted nuclease of predicted toxin-antitoxin system
VKGILLDANISNLREIILNLFQAINVLELWADMKLGIHLIRDFGFEESTSDRIIWTFAQEQQFILMTDNRNHDGSDSLEQTLRDTNSDLSLPVVTISNRDMLRTHRSYALRFANKLIEVISDTFDGQYRGIGRVYIP